MTQPWRDGGKHSVEDKMHKQMIKGRNTEVGYVGVDITNKQGKGPSPLEDLAVEIKEEVKLEGGSGGETDTNKRT